MPLFADEPISVGVGIGLLLACMIIAEKVSRWQAYKKGYNHGRSRKPRKRWWQV